MVQMTNCRADQLLPAVRALSQEHQHKLLRYRAKWEPPRVSFLYLGFWWALLQIQGDLWRKSVLCMLLQGMQSEMLSSSHALQVSLRASRDALTRHWAIKS